MKLKWQKEMKWLLLAALAFLFLFERSDTLTVQDGYVRLCRRTWWFYKREVKSAEVSLIENVTHISKLAGKDRLDSLLLKDKSGRVFHELHYSGFKIGADWWKVSDTQGVVYSLDGRRVAKPSQLGIYIRGGKKIIIKD